jgi:thiol-disulfide isomerase/thioredoxin
MKFLCALFLLLIVGQFGYGQQTLTQLKVGDKMPEVMLTNIRNYSKKTAPFSSFKKQLTIIDFWGKGCPPCIGAFPKMEDLKNQFKDKLEILLVTRDSDAELKLLFENSANLKATKLPIVIGDRVLHDLFPHTGIPYHVWIDSNGVVLAANNAFITTSNNIQNFLDHGQANFLSYEGNTNKGLRESPIIDRLKALERPFDRIKSYSILTKKNYTQSGSRSGLLVDSNGVQLGGYMINNGAIINLFQCTLSESVFETIVEAKKPGNLVKYYEELANQDSLANWYDENIYCYETKFPASFENLSVKERILKGKAYIRQDLERYFSITSFIEKRDMKCLVLFAKNNLDNLRSKGEEGIGIREKTKEGVLIMNNKLIGDISQIINNEYFPAKNRIIIDETNYKGKIDLQINLKNKDLEAFRLELNKYGLDFREEIRPLNCLVLKEI